MRILAGTAAAVAILFVAWVFVQPAAAAEQCGKASWYGTESGSKTANGEYFDGTSFTAASLTLPIGARVRITMRDPRPEMKRFWGKHVDVRINDRGPYIKGRFLDVAHRPAGKIGLTLAGTARVCIERLSP